MVAMVGAEHAGCAILGAYYPLLDTARLHDVSISIRRVRSSATGSFADLPLLAHR